MGKASGDVIDAWPA